MCVTCFHLISALRRYVFDAGTSRPSQRKHKIAPTALLRALRRKRHARAPPALPSRSHSVNAIAIASRMHAANISAATTSRGVGFLRALLQVAPQPKAPFKRIVPWPSILAAIRRASSQVCRFVTVFVCVGSEKIGVATGRTLVASRMTQASAPGRRSLNFRRAALGQSARLPARTSASDTSVRLRTASPPLAGSWLCPTAVTLLA
jgi:hypothetical protein